jgi:hypothetical protein
MQCFQSLLLFGVVVRLAIATPAHGHDLYRADLNSWYQSLHSRGKSPCCDGPGKDAAHIVDLNWGRQDKPSSHYWVIIEGEQQDVSDDALVEGPNLDGGAIVWGYRIWNGKFAIRCFMPGNMG